MNVRIKEIAVQSGWPNNTHPDDYQVVGPKFVEKFSELLIADCMKALEPTVFMGGTAHDTTKKVLASVQNLIRNKYA